MDLGPDIVEVHSVRVVSTTGSVEREIYGTIQLEDHWGCVDLYKQKRDNPKSTCQNGTLPLTGPSRCFDGSDFGINLLLKERHQQHDQDLDVGRGHHPMGPSTAEYFVDKSVRSVFRGKDGYSVVHFTVVRNAIQANVEIAIVTNAKNQRSHHFVHGSLIARCSKYTYKSKYDMKYCRTTLFNVPEDKPQELEFSRPEDDNEKKNKIPLSRNVVPVTLDDKLIIEADLWCKPCATSISRSRAKRVKQNVSEPPAQHVETSVDFVAQYNPSEPARVKSRFFEVGDVCIEFKVTFSYLSRWSSLVLSDD